MIMINVVIDCNVCSEQDRGRLKQNLFVAKYVILAVNTGLLRFVLRKPLSNVF